MSASTQELLNATTWSKGAVRRELDGARGFIDPGERVVYTRVRDEVRGQPILDVGVGTGRTVPLYLPLTNHYEAIDCLPAMVQMCRMRHPGARIALGDARTLDGFASARFRLVNFSYNGIDAVSHEDRARVFAAVRRVLVPGGYFTFSTLNLDGPTFQERPWRLRVWPTRNPAKYVWRAVKQILAMPYDLQRWLSISESRERGEGYAVAPLSAHHYGVLCHYTTLGRQLEELAGAGFVDALAYDCRAGERVRVGDDTSPFDWFHIVARAA